MTLKLISKAARAGGPGRCAVTVLAVAVGLSAFAPSMGCVDINGGAVEVSWALFAKDGRRITDCSCAEGDSISGSTPATIAYVRLNLVSDQNGSEPCAETSSCLFACGRSVGSTPFMIPPGPYLMSLIAVDIDGVDLPAGAVESPAPESRSVVRGQPSELEAFMLKANCRADCSKGGVDKVCTHN